MRHACDFRYQALLLFSMQYWKAGKGLGTKLVDPIHMIKWYFLYSAQTSPLIIVAWSPRTSKAPLCQCMQYWHRSRYWHRSSWILAKVKAHEARGHSLMAKSSYLARSLTKQSAHGLAVTWSWSWRQSSSVFGPSKFRNQVAHSFLSIAQVNLPRDGLYREV